MAAAETSKTLRVLVIGAGSAGLLIAHALKQVNISCTVFEADLSSTIRPRDWSFGIYWAQSPLASIIPSELVSQVEHSQVDDKTPSADDVLPIYNIETGKLICDLPSPFSLRLQRRKWLKLISQGLDIQYGKRLSGVHSDGDIVTATFTDGTQETGNLLVGSEGAHSLTREFLLGPEKGKLIPCPVVGTVAITKLPREAALKIRETHARHIIGFHPNGYFTWCGIHECVGLENPEDWTFMLMNSWISDEDPGLPSKGFELVKDVRERAKVYGSPFREIFELVPDDAPIWHGRLSLWPTQEFDSRNGTVTLAGDAAHPMTYHRGQGLNNSILDAADFLEKLKAMQGSTAEDLKKAVNDYNAALWPRGNEAVLSSEQNTMMIHNWSQLLESPLIKLGLKRK